jgi:TPR repeat protein
MAEPKDDVLFKAWDLFVGNGGAKNPERAVQMSTPAARKGNSSAALLIGIAYLKGEGARRDPAEAFRWISKAAKGDNRAGQVLIAELLLNGVGTTADHHKAREWLRKAADAGHPRGQLRYAQLLLEPPVEKDRDYVSALAYASRAQSKLPEAGFEVGIILSRDRDNLKADPVRSVAALGQAASAGHGQSQYLFATCLLAGFGVTQDHAAAMEWLEKAASQGVPGARFHLGQAYIEGIGKPVAVLRGVKLLELAAEDGEPGALNNLGLIYSMGASGLTVDLPRAIEYFRRGAESGDVDAKLNFGVATLKGIGRPADPAQGIKLISEVAASDHTLALWTLGVFELLGEGLPINEDAGVRHIRRASDLGFSDATSTLCDLARAAKAGVKFESEGFNAVLDRGLQKSLPNCQYLVSLRYGRGILVPVDHVRGLQYLHQAAQGGYHFAEADLAFMYFTGQYVEVDMEKSRYWLKRAADHGNEEALSLLKKAGQR